MRKKLSRILFFFFLSVLGFCVDVSAQGRGGTTSRRAEKLFKDAEISVRHRNFDKAIALLKKAIDKDPNYIDAYFRLASCYQVMARRKEQLAVYERVLEMGGGKTSYPVIYALVAEAAFENAEYERAIDLAQKYLATAPKDRRYRKTAEEVLAKSQFALGILKNPTPFSPYKLPAPLNQFGLQYFPTFTVDGKMILFTCREKYAPGSDEDIFFSVKGDDGKWSVPQSISKNINTPANEGTCAISADGKTLIFTSCSQGGGNLGSCDLYISKWDGADWSVPKNLGRAINSRSWESQPALSPDGRALYFVSDRPGGYGGRDIYFSYKNENEEWELARNLGRSINTKDDEIAPFVHVNGGTLYFGSEGHPGLGGYDLFYSERAPDGSWGGAKHMGYPINNHRDQISLFVSTDGSKGYYSEDEKKEGQLYSYMYEFDIPERLRIKNRVNYVKGLVLDDKTDEPLFATIDLMDINADSLVARVNSDSINGDYSFVLTQGREYGLFAVAEGYLFKTLSFDYVASQDTVPIKMDIRLSPVEENLEARLSNVFFETNSYEIKKKSETELTKVARFLRSNPGMIVEIQGHTDNVGGDQDNLRLSWKRAESVYNALVSFGVEKMSMRFKGYGETRPERDNETEDGRQFNRRIQFKIVKK
ncbi:cell envelope biogenesis protein OmpA [Fulvitalea axinellae]|uniref:Cell envelope biogenesis protein OmpA n=1 Tax=Fulvitalea axinellae TaxID=1182444 RepID=A0AAU9CIA9_9BACT|nr:cell envelope biogenesis protein OmpA [Fulvitalea axinellae]